MIIPDVKEKWTGSVNEVILGATREQGGTRDKVIRVGGAKTIPLMSFEGPVGNRPVIAVDVLDVAPTEWPAPLMEAVKDVARDPAAWAKKAIGEWGADLVCIKLDGLNPDGANRSADQAVETVLKVKQAVGCPLIIWGCDDDAKDNEIMPKVSQAMKGERCLLGCAKKDNYRTITAVCHADGHCLIALAPLDINIQKQVNILVSEMEFPLDRIVMFPTTGGLGYGLEYAYSIQERGRAAALSGDKMMMMPVLVDAGNESWRAKEAKAEDADAGALWGPQKDRGPAWEMVTAVALLQAGSDIIRMRHPKAIEAVRRVIDDLTK
jgi:acetyl-CoA decarbonylase/synthase complex subunit delta